MSDVSLKFEDAILTLWEKLTKPQKVALLTKLIDKTLSDDKHSGGDEKFWTAAEIVETLKQFKSYVAIRTRNGLKVKLDKNELLSRLIGKFQEGKGTKLDELLNIYQGEDTLPVSAVRKALADIDRMLEKWFAITYPDLRPRIKITTNGRICTVDKTS
ncbi:hypothetical protein HZB94_00975 [Candidatus Falkowbacteria bacterium]|nr:hypothetical protein [Candidatus Falkowbacteria bacterium]